MTNKLRMRFTGTFASHGEIAISSPSASKSSRSIDMAPRKMIDGTQRYYIPASSIRGTYRAAMHGLLCQLIEDNGLDMLTYNQHARNAVGGVKGDESGTPSPREVLNLLATNPIIDAFGGGEPVFVEGRVKIYDAASTEVAHATMAKGGVRADPFRRNPSLTERHMADVANYEKVVELTATLRPWTDAQRILESPKARKDAALVEKTIERLEQQVGETGLNKAKIDAKVKVLETDRKAAGGSSNTLLRPLPDVEVIPQGEFTHRIEIERAHDHTVGMLVTALAEMASEKMRFGGLSSKGNGFVTATYDVDILVGYEWVRDCRIILNGATHTFQIIPAVPNTKTEIERCQEVFTERFNAGALDFAFKGFPAPVNAETEELSDAA